MMGQDSLLAVGAVGLITRLANSIWSRSSSRFNSWMWAMLGLHCWQLFGTQTRTEAHHQSQRLLQIA